MALYPHLYMVIHTHEVLEGFSCSHSLKSRTFVHFVFTIIDHFLFIARGIEGNLLHDFHVNGEFKTL